MILLRDALVFAAALATAMLPIIAVDPVQGGFACMMAFVAGSCVAAALHFWRRRHERDTRRRTNDVLSFPAKSAKRGGVYAGKKAA